MGSCRKLYDYESNETLLKKAQSGDKVALNTFAENNLGLVSYTCKRFLNKGYDYEDLFQIGSVGLSKAINYFNFDFNVRFATYAVPFIVGEIQTFIRNDSKIRRKDKKEHTAGNIFISIHEVVYQSTTEPITYMDVLRDSQNLENEVVSKQTINEALNILTEKERNAVVAYYFNDLSQQKIANLYGLGQVSVSRALKSATVKMKAYYEGR